MCLEIRRKNIKIAKKDIVCYKVLVNRGDGYVTPYQFFPMPLGYTYKNSDTPKIIWDRGKGWVHQGFFHTYIKLYDAKNDADWQYENCEEDDVIVVKAVIPKGSHYLSGVNNDGEKSYASKMLVVTDIVKYSLA